MVGGASTAWWVELTVLGAGGEVRIIVDVEYYNTYDVSRLL